MEQDNNQQNRPKWTGFFKVVQPIEQTVFQTDSQSIDGSLYNNYSWYQFVTYGSAARLTRYREYDVMDQDVDIARALDIIAEEMRGNIDKKKMPLDIEIYNDSNTPTDTNIAAILNMALRKWCVLHKFHTRMFPTCRKTLKYGDCLYRKRDGGKRWEPISPKELYGAIVDQEDVTRVLGYYIRKNSKNAHGTETMGGYSNVSAGQVNDDGEVVPASEVVRFTVNQELQDTAPFGDSILMSVYATFKKKQMLEDSIVIYRITRAPEKRVFKIDTRGMSPARAAQYLETVKNDLNQKKIPSTNGGSLNVESVYNPAGQLEDFFFSVDSNGNGSSVDILPGGQNLGNLEDLDYFEEKLFRGLRVPMSYMKNSADNPQVFNDGKPGLAYIEELRFAQYVERLQANIEDVLDHEFKIFLREELGFNIEPNSYRVRLPSPSNFGIYREQELNAELLNSFGSADGVRCLSKRFAMTKYLKLTEMEIAQNERWRMQELGIKTTDPLAFRKIYDEEFEEDEDTSGGSLSDMEMNFGGGGGGGEESGPGTGEEDLGGEDLANANDEGDLNAGGGDKMGTSSSEKVSL